MKQFRANTAHNSCSKAGSSVLGQSKCLGSIRHAIPHVRMTFVLQNSRKLLKTLDSRRQPLHCLLQTADDFPWQQSAPCNIWLGAFEIRTIYFSSKAIYYELCQCGIYSAFSTSGTDVSCRYVSSRWHLHRHQTFEISFHRADNAASVSYSSCPAWQSTWDVLLRFVVCCTVTALFVVYLLSAIFVIQVFWVNIHAYQVIAHKVHFTSTVCLTL